ncbi:MAG: hypothetical protein HQL15_07455 [Candidatus Omnitrophica bacterium]|nr:hypothetical protein [Candidatus Omnitrophota bacterium]
MKKHILLLNIVLAALVSQFSVAQASQVITLKDGSQVKGDPTGLVDGVYTVHTATMGDVKVNSSEVASIADGSAAPAVPATPGTDPNALNQKIQTAQTALMNDPAMMQQVQAMAQDPEMMKLLSDPALVAAVTSHDVKAIENNPKAQELVNNPKMKALMEQLGGKVSQ